MNQPSQPTDIRRDLVALLPRLRRFALTLTRSAAEADELVRETANRAIQKSHHWKGEGRIENWLFSLVRTTWADELKKRRRGDGDSAYAPLGSEGSRQIGATLALPDGLASAFLLADVENFTYAEAAAILGIHSDLFASRLCAARIAFATTEGETSERWA